MDSLNIAQLALSTIGLAEPELMATHGWSNDAWVGQDVVVRVGDDRLFDAFAHEQRIGPPLRAAGIPVPECLAYGTFRDLGVQFGGLWIVVRRVPGTTMSDAWPTLSPDERTVCARDLGEILRALHMSSLDIDAPQWWRRAHSPGSLHNAYHATPSLMFAIADAVELLPECDSPKLRAIREFLAERLAFVDGSAQVPLHTDAHGFNVMVDGGRVAALLDWESARQGAACTELDMLLRYWGTGASIPRAPGESPPALTVGEGVATIDAIAAGYPELFALPHLRERAEFHDGLWKLHGLLVAKFFGNPVGWDEVEAVLDRDTHLRNFAHLF